MPLPLLPVVAVAGAAAWLGMNEQGQAPGVVPAPEEQKPYVDAIDPPVAPMPISTTTTPVTPGGAPPPDLAMSVIEGAVGDVVGEAKTAVVGAASVAIGGVLAGEGLGTSVAAGVGSVGSSVGGAAESAAGVVGPGVVVVADVAMVAGAFYTMFGGDLSNLFPTYATTPAFDATTAEGQARARAQAKLIRQDLIDSPGNKWGFKGAPDPAGLIAG